MNSPNTPNINLISANELSALLLDPENGALLRANWRLRADGKWEERPNSVFRLNTGELRHDYVVVSGLYHDAANFDRCADTMATKIADAYSHREIRFAALACCTARTKYLMIHVHARLSQRWKESKSGGIVFGYHGMYPLQPGRSRVDYGGAGVLLVCDSVDSGKQCESLGRDVEECNGKVVAVVCVASIESPEQLVPRASIRICGRDVPMYPLCVLPTSPPGDANGRAVIDLDVGEVTRHVISDRRYGMLLDAKEHDARLNPDPAAQASNPIFQGAAYQRQYVTVWNLFDKPWLFEDAMEHMAQTALRIRGSSGNWFSSIITCSSTGRYLMEHLQPRIETLDDPVEVHYLGPFPYHGLRHRDLDLKNQPVLIVTDVISKGRLVRNVIEVVERLHGKPVAVLSVVKLVNPNHTDPDPEVGVPMYALATYDLERIESLRNGAEGPVDRIYQIDPSTVLPVEPAQNGFHPLLDVKTSLRHFEDSKALTVGFFGSGSRRLTAAINLDLLLTVKGDEIWTAIGKVVPGDSTLVTNFSKEDGEFRDFALRRLAQENITVESVSIPRSESIEFDFPYFVTAGTKKLLEGRTCTLLLSSMQTSEKLRKLVALLAQCEVKAITVICLLNRMGSRTVEFVSRIQRMLLRTGQTEEAFNFRFEFVYEVQDLHGEALRRTLETIDWLVKGYASSTSEQTYRSLAEQELNRYFRTHSLKGRQFESRRPESQSGTFSVHADEWEYTTADGKIYAMFCHIARKRESGAIRDYLPLIQNIPAEKSRPHLYLLYAFLLSDVSYLRLSGQFEELRRTLMQTVQDSREHRMSLERTQPGRGNSEKLNLDISEAVKTETYWLFGLALCCYMDENRAQYSAFLISVLTCGVDNLDDWFWLPCNLEHYYGNERVLWCVSMIVHFMDEKSRNALHAEMKEIAYKHRSHIKNLGGADNDNSIQTKLRYVWDSFLTDLGEHQALELHQIIRRLHALLIEPRRNHILAVKEPRRAVDALNILLLDGSKPEAKPVSFAGTPFGELRRALEDAIQASATLESVAGALSKLFSFYPAGYQDVARYAAGIQAKTPGFWKEVAELRRVFQEIRNRREVTGQEARHLEQSFSRIESELTLSDSPVMQALLWYVVPLQEKIISAMEHADAYLQSSGIPALWHSFVHTVQGDDRVLIDPTALKDVLWNILTNVRHGLNADEDPKDQIQWKMSPIAGETPPPESDFVECVKIEIHSPLGQGRHPEAGTATLAKQQRLMRQYGGALEYGPDPGTGRFRVSLTLILRNKTFEAWSSRFRKQ